MTAEILLDFEGDLPALPEVQVIESEVDFLRYATADKTLLIRGEKLCAWAEDFYSLRRVAVRRMESPSAVLRRMYPVLSKEQAQELANKINKTMLSADDCRPTALLPYCYPEDGDVWYGKPSIEHAARWLVWLFDHSPTPAEKVILNHFLDTLKEDAIRQNLLAFYEETSSEQAKDLLLRWLGIGSPFNFPFSEFPLDTSCSRALTRSVREEWEKQIIKSEGKVFAERLRFPLSLSWRKEFATLTAEFFQQHPNKLSVDALGILRPYLAEQLLKKLERALPPPVPAELPSKEEEVISWFEREYLPYRRWQVNFGDETARQVVIQRSQAFAKWVLDRYPHWLLEGDWLSFQRTAHFSKLEPNETVFCIIMDGLPAWDASDLAKKIFENIPRLTLINQTHCFAPIPTITEFAKDALFKGVQPKYAVESKPLGEILADQTSPKELFSQVQDGGLWFWRVEQPDKAYHFIPEETLQYRIQAELGIVVDKIKEIVFTIQENLNLRVIITSDHGRLLNPRSLRELTLPEKMHAHGRAAWGCLDKVFPEEGYLLSENNEWVDLHGNRYGLTTDLRIAWDETCFLTANQAGGEEPYPHGGLFPEEMIVPWFVFVRDAHIPQPEITLKGSGEAGMVGELRVSILNRSQVTLECLSIQLSHGLDVSINWLIPPLSEKTFKVTISSWPKKAEAENLRASLLLRQPTGRLFTCEVAAQLEVRTLYEKKYNPLEDLR